MTDDLATSSSTPWWRELNDADLAHRLTRVGYQAHEARNIARHRSAPNTAEWITKLLGDVRPSDHPR